MQDATLSTYGQNVKIITERGKVTLNGPVASNAERDRIIDMAARIAGRSSVVSGLDVAK
jgi:osmotically-inducible protein OsmY